MNFLQGVSPVGDDKLLASDVRMGVRLLANGTSTDANNANQPASGSRAPVMFDDQELPGNVRDRRQSLQTDLLNAHEVSQVMLIIFLALRTGFAVVKHFWLLCTSRLEIQSHVCHIV